MSIAPATLGVAPFLVGDAIKAVAAATLLPIAWKFVR
jgi:biotin transporter BioY